MVCSRLWCADFVPEIGVVVVCSRREFADSGLAASGGWWLGLTGSGIRRKKYEEGKENKVKKHPRTFFLRRVTGYADFIPGCLGV